STFRRPLDHASAWALNRVRSLAVVIASREITRLPRASWIIVRIRIACICLLGTRKQTSLPDVLFLGVNDNVVVILGEVCGGAFRRINLFPDDRRDEVVAAENFIHQRAEVLHFIVVDTHKDGSLLV